MRTLGTSMLAGLSGGFVASATALPASLLAQPPAATPPAVLETHGRTADLQLVAGMVAVTTPISTSPKRTA